MNAAAPSGRRPTGPPDVGRATRVLVVDDDRHLLRLVAANLARVGYTVLTASDGIQGTTLAAREEPDLVILDVMMPGRDGFQVTEAIRGFSDVPIVLLTAKGDETDKVRGLDAGADDYLTKPFGVEELLARVRAVLRRRYPADAGDGVIEVGPVRIDTRRRQVLVRGEEVHLTPTEYRLLLALASEPNRVFLHEELLQRVWGPEYRDDQEYLWAYVRYLRKKIEDDPANPRLVLTEPGVGYRFCAADPSGGVP